MIDWLSKVIRRQFSEKIYFNVSSQNRSIPNANNKFTFNWYRVVRDANAALQFAEMIPVSDITPG